MRPVSKMVRRKSDLTTLLIFGGTSDAEAVRGIGRGLNASGAFFFSFFKLFYSETEDRE